MMAVVAAAVTVLILIVVIVLQVSHAESLMLKLFEGRCDVGRLLGQWW